MSEETEFFALIGRYHAALMHAFEYNTYRKNKGYIPNNSVERTFYEFKPTKDSIEFTTFLREPDSPKVRLDYEFKLGEVIPLDFSEQIAKDYWTLRNWADKSGKSAATYYAMEKAREEA